ncbi:MAG TPA: VWA domain-containing protein [Thermoanaerobaculia bacterium]|jgi:VWFA-related protein
MARRLIAFCFAFVLAAVPLLAQPFGETIEVSLVNVDVVVTDRQGRHVGGLTADDFEVYGSGRRQPVTHFRESAAAAGEPGQKRSLVLFFDQLPTTVGQDRARLFGELKAFVRQSVRPGDAVSILEWQRGLHVRQPFTDDLAALERALDDVARPEVRASRENTEMMHWTRVMRRRWSQQVGESRNIDRRIEWTAVDSADRALAEMKGKAAALRVAIGSMAPRDGRKALVMVSHRFSQFAGGEYLVTTAERANRYYDTAGLQREVIQAANAGGVTIYPLFPEGLPMSEVSEADDDMIARQGRRTGYSRNFFRNESAALTNLATSTGGFMAFSVADITRMLPRIAAELESYYSLAFPLPDAKPGPRKIGVRAKRDGLRVRFRREYVVESDQDKLRGTLTAALFEPAGTARGELPWRYELAAPEESGGKLLHRITLQIPVRALTAVPDGRSHNGAFEVYVLTVGGGGELGEVQRGGRRFQIANAELERVRAGVFTYDLAVETPPGGAKVAIAVVDGVAKTHGIVRVDF